jgi:hypothetical protein
MLAARLTIGIPTQGKRPDLLSKAIGSALAQSQPARVLVCGRPDAGIQQQLEPYAGHPLVRFSPSDASCLWENWRHAVDNCDTELFAWLQDDDVVAPHFSRRVTEALDRTPEAVAWIARLGISTLPGQANWWQATGPMVPMDLIHGGTTAIDGRLLTAGAYFSSFALSPAVAFRWSLDTVAAVAACPARGCDLYNERLVLAELGRLGSIVCDPVVAGYWVMHEANESRKQVTAGEGDEQFRVMARRIDAMLNATPGWQDIFRGWSCMIGHENLVRFLDGTAKFAGLTPTLDESRALLEELRAAGVRDIELEAKVERAEAVEVATNRKARRAERAVRR